MTRQTSIEAYHKIKYEGLLSERRWQFYDALFNHGPLTATELCEHLPGETSRSVGANVHARLGELLKMGVVQEIGEKVCSISGQNVILWDVTPNLPNKLQDNKKKEVKWICNFCHMAFKMDIASFSKHPETCMGKLERYVRSDA